MWCKAGTLYFEIWCLNWKFCPSLFLLSEGGKKWCHQTVSRNWDWSNISCNWPVHCGFALVQKFQKLWFLDSISVHFMSNRANKQSGI